MFLKKKTAKNDKIPENYISLLLLVKTKDFYGEPIHIWSTGKMTPEGWIIDYELQYPYTVICWYELPPR